MIIQILESLFSHFRELDGQQHIVTPFFLTEKKSVLLFSHFHEHNAILGFPDLVCELDSVQGIVDSLTSVRWKPHQDAVVVEETGCVQAKVYLQRELFLKYEYKAQGRPRFGLSLRLFVDCLNTSSVPGRSSILELRYPGPDMQLLLRMNTNTTKQWWILAKDVRPTNTGPLLLRVVRFYKRVNFVGKQKVETMEVLLHDEEGGRISGFVSKKEIPRFQSSFVEGKVYAIHQYNIEQNNGSSKATLGDWMIEFQKKSVVVERPNEKFPSFTYNFRSFNTLVDENTVNQNDIFDLIGRVVEVYPSNSYKKKRTGEMGKRMVITIHDLSGNRLQCTLFDEFVDKMEDFVAFETPYSPRVAIFQLFKMNIYDHKVQVQNDFYGSKIITDPTVPDIAKFISSIPEGWIEQNMPTRRGKTTLSRSEKEDLEHGDLIVKPIDCLYTVDEACQIWVCATVTKVFNQWWFYGCNTCGSRLFKTEKNYICKKCKAPRDSGSFKYRLQLGIREKNACATVMCWDPEAEKLIGKSCHNLRENQKSSDDLPNEIERLIDQPVLLKLKVLDEQIHDEKSVFSVAKLETDNCVVSKYNKDIVEDSEYDLLKMILEADENNQTNNGDSSESEVEETDSEENEINLNSDEDDDGISVSKRRSFKRKHASMAGVIDDNE